MNRKIIISLALLGPAFICGGYSEEVALTAERATVITFPSQTQRTYKLLAADSASGAWETLQDGIVGTGGEVTIFYKSESNQKLFFKVETSDGPPGQRSLLSLASLDISNKDLSGYDLEGNDLRGHNFEFSKFDGANLSAANLSEAKFDGATFVGADLTHIVAVRVSMQGANLNGANLEGVRFDGGTLRGADLLNANLKGVVFEGTEIGAANFAGANLSGSDLSRNSATWINLNGANITDVNFEGTHLSGVSMISRDLRSVFLRGIHVEFGNWIGVNAAGVDMSLTSASHRWVLNGANFEAANLEGLSFSLLPPTFSSIIANVNFRNANLQGAYLTGIAFTNCNFTGADLSFANVVAARFFDCVGLDPDQPGMQFGAGTIQGLGSSINIPGTILPDGSLRFGTNPGTSLAPAIAPPKLRFLINDRGTNGTVNLMLDGGTYSQVDGLDQGSFTYEARGRKAVLKLNSGTAARNSARTLLFTSPSAGELYNSDSGASYRIGTFTVPQ
jgi:uncharacterized protein YjbI with pentapeptide repeats